MQESNFQLKAQFIAKDGKMVETARKLDMREDRLSRIIHRRVTPSDEEKRKIAWHLQKSIVELFG